MTAGPLLFRFCGWGKTLNLSDMGKPACRLLLSLALTLLLAFTSLGMAVARGQHRGMEQVVICSGPGVVMVTLDAQGNPVGPASLCPDGALSLFLALDLPVPGGAHILPAAPPVFALAAQTPPVRGVSAQRVRAPPLSA